MIATDASTITVDPNLALVIDDDDKIRDFIGTTLVKSGMKVATFEMAKEALASLDAGHPSVIFLDVALLRSDAIDVLRGLGERHYGGVVQLMSGGRQMLLEAVQRIGVRHGIRLAEPINKPVAREVITQLIESLRASAAAAAAPADPGRSADDA